MSWRRWALYSSGVSNDPLIFVGNGFIV